MNLNLTTGLALWGASVGSLSLAWNIWAWCRSRPRIKAKIELREGGFEPNIRYEIRNQGDKPTTIEEIMLVKYQDGILGFFGMAEHVEYFSGVNRKEEKLPAPLAPGELWSHSSLISENRRAGSMDTLALIESGRLYFQIRCTHTDRKLSGKVKRENLLAI